MSKKQKFVPTFGVDVKTPVGRIIFCKVARPVPYKGNQGEPRYSANIIVKNSDAVQAIIKDCESVGLRAFGPAFNEEPHNRPYKMGDAVLASAEKDLSKALYAGNVVFNVIGKLKNFKGEAIEPPRCYLADGSKLPRRPGNEEDIKLIEQTFYDGCYCTIAVTPAAYQQSSSVRGVKLIFKGIQFIKDGQRIGGVDTDTMFAAPVAEEGFEFGEDTTPFDAEVAAGSTFSEAAEEVKDVNF